jgi:hypothetical protein
MGKRFGSGPPDDHGQVLKKDGHADGRDQRGQTGGLSQWAIGNNIQQHAADRTAGHGDAKCNVKGQTQEADESDSEKGAQHVDFAMSKVDKLDNTVDHGVTHGDHGVYTADGQSVDKLL